MDLVLGSIHLLPDVPFVLAAGEVERFIFIQSGLKLRRCKGFGVLQTPNQVRGVRGGAACRTYKNARLLFYADEAGVVGLGFVGDESGGFPRFTGSSELVILCPFEVVGDAPRVTQLGK